MKFKTLAKRTDAPGKYEKANAAVARMAAGEGIVLLKNEGVLPIPEGEPVALYGEGAAMTVKGGIGSGEVNSRYNVSIWEGLAGAGYSIVTRGWLNDYKALYHRKKDAFRTQMRKRAGLFNFGVLKYLLEHPFSNPEGMAITENYLDRDARYCIYVLTRQAGENVDRMPVKGDFLMTDMEVENIRICCREYKNVIVAVNVGGYMDLSPLDALPVKGLLFFGQQGAEGGNAFADIIRGAVTPSAHLTASWPQTYGDVPFGSQFSTLNGNTVYEDYQEGIYVGYRYYDTFGVAPRYPFGFGLSYTTFKTTYETGVSGQEIHIRANVENTGKFPGKAVVQVYVSCPLGRLDKEYQRLTGFGKTGLMACGETAVVDIIFKMTDLVSYDEVSNCSILEPGDYIVRAGAHSRETQIIGMLTLEHEVTVARHSAICPKQRAFEELKPANVEAGSTYGSGRIKPDGLDGSDYNLNVRNIRRHVIDGALIPTKVHTYGPVKARTGKEIEKLQRQLKGENLADICMGSGLDIALPQHHAFIVPGAGGYSTSKFEKQGIPAISFCDGPAGLRLFDISVIHGKSVRMARPVMASFDMLPKIARSIMVRKPKKNRTLYQYTTAFPSGLAMGQTWSVEMIAAVGKAVQKEMAEFGAQFWLAPGMNIHRNPLCGRNYEYYSEDPMLSGTLAAAMCRSVQSRPGFGVTVKHFACNNQEIDRRTLSENVGQRALREIYLRNFEIAVKTGRPKALMTSYNKINGVYAAENKDLVTKVLRNEWGFEGLVMTDWTTEKGLLDSSKSMAAGVNLMMPGIRSDRTQICRAMRTGQLSEKDMRINASYVLEAVAQSRLYHMKKEQGR